MPRPVLEVADILRRHGDVYRERNASHLSRDQLKVMGAVQNCRTAALGGHVGAAAPAVTAGSPITAALCALPVMGS